MENIIEKYVINRLRDSYYIKTTRTSGFFSPKTEESTYLRIKGFDYNTAGWYHGLFKDYVECLNKPFDYDFKTYKDFVERNKDLVALLHHRMLKRCINFEDSFSFYFFKNPFKAQATYNNKHVEDFSTHLYQGKYSIVLNLSENKGTERIYLSYKDGEILTDIFSIGFLLQLETNPSCMGYYQFLPSNFLELALLNNWIKR